MDRNSAIDKVETYANQAAMASGTIKTTNLYTYDANGNITADDKHLYRYDFDNQLTEIAKKTNGDIVEKFGYDPLGRRVYIDKGGIMTRFTYAGKDAIEEQRKDKTKNARIFSTENLYSGRRIDEIVAILKNEDVLTTDEKADLKTCQNTILYRWNAVNQDYAKYLKVKSGSVTEEQITEVDTAIDDCNALVARSEQRSEVPYYFHADHLGSIRAITNGSGEIVEQYRYSVYGKPTIWNSAKNRYDTFSTSKIGNTRLYTGREYDSTSGLYYYRARYYSPVLGRFISRDPIGYGDGVNAYRYVHNDPMSFTDPSGEFADFMLGIGDSVIDTIKGLATAAMHPITTAEGIANGLGMIVMHPIITAESIVSATINSLQTERGAGNFVGNVLLSLIPAERVLSLAKNTQTLAKIGSKIERISEIIGELHGNLIAKNAAGALERKGFTTFFGFGRSTARDASKILGLGEYRFVKGHHIIAKAAFEGEAYEKMYKYGLSMSDDLLAEFNILHKEIQPIQQRLYSELMEAGGKNSLDLHYNVAWKALNEVGMPLGEAQKYAKMALDQIKDLGIKPTRVPWH